MYWRLFLEKNPKWSSHWPSLWMSKSCLSWTFISLAFRQARDSLNRAQVCFQIPLQQSAPGRWGQSPQVVFGLFFISNWSRPWKGHTGEPICSLVTESVDLRAFTPREEREEMVYIVWPSVSCEETNAKTAKNRTFTEPFFVDTIGDI